MTFIMHCAGPPCRPDRACPPTRSRRPKTDYDPAISGEIMRAVGLVLAGRARRGEGHRPPRRHGTEDRGMLPPIWASAFPPWCRVFFLEEGSRAGGDMGHRAGRRGRHAPDRLRPSAALRTRTPPSCRRPTSSRNFQGGGFDMSFLSFLEVDVEGNVNVSKLGKKPYLTARLRRLRRHHGACAKDRVLRLFRGRARSST